MNLDPKETITLQVICDGEVKFQSQKHWLIPLFDLMDFLKESQLPMERAELCDRIVGRAAALLMLRLRAGRVHGNLMSKLAVDVFQRARIPYSFDRSVERIECATEFILQGIDDPEIAYRILRKRA